MNILTWKLYIDELWGKNKSFTVKAENVSSAQKLSFYLRKELLFYLFICFNNKALDLGGLNRPQSHSKAEIKGANITLWNTVEVM